MFPASGVPEKRISATHEVRSGTDSIRVEIADTDAERARGLSGVTSLASGEGMLFVFDEDGIYSFWMHEMLISIDIIWIDAERTVVHIEHAVSPSTYPSAFTPGTPARYVLEVPAGFALEHEIEVGSKLQISPIDSL